MSRLTLPQDNKVDKTVNVLLSEFNRRITATPPGVCPVDMQLAWLRLCHSHTCGKCVPCRIGLDKLGNLLELVLENKGTEETLEQIKTLAEGIKMSADCAIGFEAAEMVLQGLDGFRDDYISHVQDHKCIGAFEQPIPCVSLCPAHVDIPGYVALAGEGRCADAIRLIRKDNPFPTACALICEHPCETKCRRNMIDDSINIRGMKKYAVDTVHTTEVPAPECAPSTGKKIAIIGGGPSGLTAAYFLQLMGHQCTVFEARKKLGGMLRYGIPKYRFPRERLQEDIDVILSTGVEVKRETKIDTMHMEVLKEEYDAIYIAIGAHNDKKLGLEGEDAEGVISAVDLLRKIGDDDYPDFTGKSVVVVGGGNVAMDCARTAVRAHAKNVSIAYRRRQEDMTALPEEVEGAIAEGVELITLHAPVRIETNEEGKVAGLVVQPQIIGPYRGGRPAPRKADFPEKTLKCDIVLVAIGQDIDSKPFERFGVTTKWKQLCATPDAATNIDGVFTGGDCQTGPATVIKAIAAGKVVAANIDEYLGFHHPITCDVDIPEPLLNDKTPCGRVNIREVESWARKENFDHIELVMSAEEAKQEASRCLRCDRYGCGAFKGGRQFTW